MAIMNIYPLLYHHYSKIISYNVMYHMNIANQTLSN